MLSKMFYLKECFKHNGIGGVYNLYKNYFTLRNKPRIVKAKPILLGLELTTRCTLNCIMCFRSRMRKDRIGDLSFENYTKILDQFGHVINLCLSGLGENLLHPDVFPMISYAKNVKKISFVWMASNGLLIDKKISRKIVNSGLDWLLISVDSPIPQIYERIRRGGNFERLTRCIKILISVKRGCGNIGPRITLDMTIQKDNKGDLLNFVKFAHRLGVSDVIFAQVNPSFAGEAGTDVGKYVMSKKEIDNVKNIAKRIGVKVEFADYPYCFEPWLRPCITWDGYVIPCYTRPVAEEFNFGNVFEKPFEEIWNNDKFREFRAGEKPEICKGCPRIWKDY